MSINSRYRERKYNSSENDRLLRALSQPVQAWDKKWTSHADTKKLSIYKWVKSERTIHFEPDEESEDEPVEMDQDKEPLDQDTAETPTSQQKTDSFSAIPGGHSSLLQSAMNKTVSSLQMEDDERSHTPNLDDISDVESDRNLDDDNDNDVDSVSDPSKHPALAPHAQAHMTDDDMMTDSSVATPADERADQVMEEAIQHPHPLSQEPISAEPSGEFASSSTAPVAIPQAEPAPVAPSAQEASYLEETTAPESSIQDKAPMVDDPMQEAAAPELSSQDKAPVVDDPMQETTAPESSSQDKAPVVDDPMQEDLPQVDQQQDEESKPSQEEEKEVNPQEETTMDTIDQSKSDEAAAATPDAQNNTSEPTKVIIQEPTQEATQEITIEPAQQTTQESPRETPQEIPQETAADSTLDAIQAPQEAVEEPVKTPQEEAVQEKPAETIQEAPLAQEEVPKEETPSEEAPAVAIPTFDATSPKDVAAFADANTTVGLPATVEALSTDEKQEPVAVVTDEPMEH